MPVNTPVILNVSMLPPFASGAVTTTVNGRAYTAAQGTILNNIPGYDANRLEPNGWIRTTDGGAGATALRPVNPQKGTRFYDSTVGATVIWTGAVWAHIATGAAS